VIKNKDKRWRRWWQCSVHCGNYKHSYKNNNLVTSLFLLHGSNTSVFLSAVQSPPNSYFYSIFLLQNTIICRKLYVFLFEYYPFLISVFLAFLPNLRLYSLYSFYNPTRQNPFVFSHVLYKWSVLHFSRSLNKRPYKILIFNSFTQFRVFS